MKNDTPLFIIYWVALAMLSGASALGVEEFAEGPGALEVFDIRGTADLHRPFQRPSRLIKTNS